MGAGLLRPKYRRRRRVPARARGARGRPGVRSCRRVRGAAACGAEELRAGACGAEELCAVA